MCLTSPTGSTWAHRELCIFLWGTFLCHGLGVQWELWGCACQEFPWCCLSALGRFPVGTRCVRLQTQACVGVSGDCPWEPHSVCESGRKTNVLSLPGKWKWNVHCLTVWDLPPDLLHESSQIPHHSLSTPKYKSLRTAVPLSHGLGVWSVISMGAPEFCCFCLRLISFFCGGRLSGLYPVPEAFNVLVVCLFVCVISWPPDLSFLPCSVTGGSHLGETNVFICWGTIGANRNEVNPS